MDAEASTAPLRRRPMTAVDGDETATGEGDTCRFQSPWKQQIGQLDLTLLQDDGGADIFDKVRDGTDEVSVTCSSSRSSRSSSSSPQSLSPLRRVGSDEADDVRFPPPTFTVAPPATAFSSSSIPAFRARRQSSSGNAESKRFAVSSAGGELSQRRFIAEKARVDGGATDDVVLDETILNEALLPDQGLILRTIVAAIETIPTLRGRIKLRTCQPPSHDEIGKKNMTIMRMISRSVSNQIRSPSILTALLSVLALVTIPLLFNPSVASTSPRGIFKHVLIGWDSLLHTSVWPIFVITMACAFLVSHKCQHNAGCCIRTRRMYLGHAKDEGCSDNVRCKWMWTSIIWLVATFSAATTVTSQLQIIDPSWIWNPFLWGTYPIYNSYDIPRALEGLCLDLDLDGENERKHPLCLSDSSWKTLSSGMLSSRNRDDVDAVVKGISYAKDESGGLVINVMSRDTIDAIEPLRYNVEGLIPFFSKLSVVIFENDSKDGSRDAFKRWASEARGYTVDLMECEEAVDCVFGESHRYDATEYKDYFKSSSIGRMAEFRQRMVDYINSSHLYRDYSHMIVLDLDLGVSLSPLGVLHTLGKLPNSAVASSGRQVWPGSFGTLVPPYDFSAFRVIQTASNARLLGLHKWFCELLPAGDRWRNQCDAVSPMQLMLVLGHDRSGTEPYQVASAFNGATLYPLRLIRETHARYDEGEDGQRCEHIGFNLSLKEPMYLNPKWNMNVNPINPGGPTGGRALRNIARIVFTPRLSVLIFSQNLGCMVVFVYAIMTLGCWAYPLVTKAFRRKQVHPKEPTLPLGDRTLRQNPGVDVFFLPNRTLPKRKYSDFVKLV